MFLGTWRLCAFMICLSISVRGLLAQAPTSSSPSPPQSASTQSAAKPASKASSKPASDSSGLDDGIVVNGVYHNKSLAMTCKIPEAWVLRTAEMNAHEPTVKQEVEDDSKELGAKPIENKPAPASSAGAKVLLATFSRPPEAKGEDVNSSIVIAAESAAAYPGLKDAAQYFEPLTEVAVVQGFTLDEDVYEIAVGGKTLARADFHKNVGSRVMHQSTLAMLARGYAVSITVIAGTEDEVEELIDGLSFEAVKK